MGDKTPHGEHFKRLSEVIYTRAIVSHGLNNTRKDKK
jgi:hypothetical protein